MSEIVAENTAGMRDLISSKLNWMAGMLAVGGVFILPISTTLTDVFLGLAVLCCLFAGDLGRKWQAVVQSRVGILFLIFFGLYIIGAIYSVGPWHDVSKSLLKDAKLLYGALLIPIFMDKKWRRYAVNALIVAMTITLALSYIKAFGIFDLGEKYSHAAVFKSHIQTNFLMAFFSYLLAIKIFDDKRWRVLWAMLFVLAVYNAIFISLGRSGYFVFAALMGLLCWQRFSWKGVIIAIFALAALGFSAYNLSGGFKHRVDQIVHNTQRYQQGHWDTSMGQRLSFYHNSVLLIKQHPVMGTGTGSFRSRYANIKPRPVMIIPNPHNEYLNVGVQLGAVGIAYLVFFFAMIWFASFSLPRKERHIAQATVMAIALGCLANSWLMDTTEGHFFAVFIALAFGARFSLSGGRQS